MTVNIMLWKGVCYQQLSAGGKFPHEDCGETEDADDLTDAGIEDSVSKIEQWMLDHSDDPISGTMIEWNVAVMQAMGLQCHEVRGDTYTFVSQALEHNHRCRVVVRVNSYGIVDAGAIPHFVTVIGYVSDVYYIRNPLGGWQTISKDVFERASEGYGIEIDYVYGEDKLTDDDRKWIEALVARMAIEVHYAANMGMQPSGKTVDYIVNEEFGVSSGKTDAESMYRQHVQQVKELSQGMEAIRAITNKENYPVSQGG